MTLAYGMAVLAIRLLFLILSYGLLQKLNWKQIVSKNNFHFAQYICLIISIAIGHLTGSFVITIMDLLRDILYSIFL